MGIIKTFVPNNPNAKVHKKLEDIPVSEKSPHEHKFFGYKIGNSPTIIEIQKEKVSEQFTCRTCAITAYYCPKCEGYLEGKPYDDKYDEIGPLSGSAGTDYYCNKCGEKIARKIFTWS